MSLLLELPELLVIHVALSVVALVSGVVAVAAMLFHRRLDSWTALFLITTGITSITGLMLPRDGFTVMQGLGVATLVALVLPLLGLYVFAMRGIWRVLEICGATLAFYFTTIAAMTQGFETIPALHALAPTRMAPPFLIAQGVLLLVFLVAGIAAIRRFRPDCSTPIDPDYVPSGD